MAPRRCRHPRFHLGSPPTYDHESNLTTDVAPTKGGIYARRRSAAATREKTPSTPSADAPTQQIKQWAKQSAATITISEE
uniref:Uncharacterized protein n=1 Tax=Oryza punctata TaxID=4537 RepID=A0A0E0LSA6_ORYPU